ncbi:MAG TPA: HIT family protein [Thermodesulfobacteriota bacterium]|nr:HIT family protein [Thermodesulfobacteriota bacterium]
MFALHQRLKDDTVEVADLALSRVLLMNDRTVPWLILVPRRAGASEVHDLSENDRAELIEEVTRASQVIRELYCPDKINIGALGNLVPQLHVHVIGRFKTDRAWPGPVWGKDGAEAYGAGELREEVARIRTALKRLSPLQQDSFKNEI